jgi:general secretion pathway protein A
MLRCELEPLRQSEVRPYIERRLSVAGARPETITFNERAIESIYDYSGGIPRIINTICENALVIGCAQRIRTIVSTVIEEVASDFHLKKSKVVVENAERRTEFYGGAASVITSAFGVQG